MEYEIARRVAIRLCLPPVALALAACASLAGDPTIKTCTQDCRLTITLPEDIALPPSIPEEQIILALRGDSELEIEVIGAPKSKVVLLFRGEQALQSAGERGRNPRALRVVLAKTGKQSVIVRPWTRARCPDQSRNPGCKYEIHDVSNPDRPPLDPWIIIRR